MSGFTRATSARYHTRRVGSFFTADSASFVVKNEPTDDPLDLIEIRQQIRALRSKHSDNLALTVLLNRFLVKIAFLSEPKDAGHARHLRSEFARTLRTVEEILSRGPSAKRSGVVKRPKSH
ncbi:hypothetical protein [Bradyrhizobium japonicum]|uniref:hypothetical protein n=1 Tax=Bradyrhizobium japonicum TaxID=375 RepID=UPI00209EC79F|nr:hypothetical protein [Bradyrhizobium japonicum]MCP1962126.1 hypothetical protein [Bradyrhizobium japonicum]